MELLAFGAVGFAIGVLALLVLGPFLFHGVTRMVGFENPTLLRSFKFYASLLLILLLYGYGSNYLLGLIIPEPQSPAAAAQSRIASLQSLIATAIMLGYMKYWYDEPWKKIIAATLSLWIVTGLVLVLTILATTLFYIGQMKN